jgi:hypothetical protein
MTVTQTTGPAGELLFPLPPQNRYAELAAEASAVLAAVQDGRRNRALRKRLAGLDKALTAMAATELAVGAIFDAGCATGAAQGTAGPAAARPAVP